MKLDTAEESVEVIDEKAEKRTDIYFGIGIFAAAPSECGSGIQGEVE